MLTKHTSHFSHYMRLLMKKMCCFLAVLLLPLPLFAQLASTPLIRVDQFGYQPDAPKVAVLANPQQGYNASDSYIPGNTIEVRRADTDEVVFSGASAVWRGGATHVQSGDQGWWFDFSAVTTPGSYYLFDPANNLQSYSFEIGEAVYADVLNAALRMFYYNRSGIAKDATHAGACWADAVSFAGPGQDTEAVFVSAPPRSNTAKDLHGGWFDAGDFNKYVTFAESVIHQLLDAYALNPEVWTDNVNIPESGNGIPDILDEIIWEVDWIKRMQDTEDGGVHIKMGSKTFDLGSPPSSDPAPRFYAPKCSSSSIAAAGMFAHAALVLAEFEAFADYVADLEARAIMAWDWYQNNPKETNCDTQIIKAGDADRSVDDQHQMAVTAAVYLFALTGAAEYNQHVVDHYLEVGHMNWWGPYGVERGDALLYYASLPAASASVANDIRSRLRNAGQSLGDFYKQDDRDLYRAQMPDAQYHWGSNIVKANTGNLNMNLLIYGQDATNHATYLEKAYSTLHYMHGVNPMNLVYLSNMGGFGAENSVDELYHGWFRGSTWGNAETSACGPAPGYVPGGPNKDYSGSQSGINNQPPQKAYRDGYSFSNSWELTEPAIYYQAAYLKLLSHFVPDQSAGVDREDAPLSPTLYSLEGYPNPFHYGTTLSYSLTHNTHAELAIYDVLGRRQATLIDRVQLAGQHEVYWNASGLPGGVYFARLVLNDHVQVRQLVLLK